MRAVKSKDSKAEMLLRSELWGRGVRYRLHIRTLPGTPDLVFSGRRLAVFVDGDFWHGRAPLEGGWDLERVPVRGAKRTEWQTKIERNMKRDLAVTSALLREGWTVLRIWESVIKADVAGAADQVVAGLQSQLLLDP